MATPRLGGKTLSNSDSTTEVTTGFAGVAAGTRITEIKVCSGPTTAPGTGVLSIIVNDGTTSYVYAELTLTNTANAEMGTLYLPNLALPSSSWNVRLQMRTAITAGGTINVVIIGYDN